MYISGRRPAQSSVLCTWSLLAPKALMLMNLCQVHLQVYGTAVIQPRNYQLN